jgi:hypothetical protein
MGKYQSRKARIFGLTWRLGPEGSLEEEIRTSSGLIIFFFFGGGDDLGGSPGAASPAAFSCESVVCSRVESWGQIWNRSRLPKLTEVSSVEDLKQALKSKQTEAIQERSSIENLTTHRGRSSEEAFSPREEEGDCPEV